MTSTAPMRRLAPIVCALTVLTGVVGAGARVHGRAQDAPEDLPPGVEQLVPRGRIPAVFEPRFVPAGEAEISADAWVLGVEIDGHARAYSLNLLNDHEVVNDRIGEREFAVVW